MYDPTFKQDPIPHLTPKKKMALDPNYYAKGYILEEEEAPLLVYNLSDPQEKNTSEDRMAKEEKEKKEQETKDKKRMEENQ